MHKKNRKKFLVYNGHELDRRIASLFGVGPDGVSPAKLARIMHDFVSGYRVMRKYQPGVTFFGSARNGLPPAAYKEAVKLARALVKKRYAVITGGGGGIMEAANRGAFLAKGHSVGLGITLPWEAGSNGYLTDRATFNYFFARKVMLASASKIYVFFPGGFGTMDELFEILTLTQTRKIGRVPIVLVGREFWQPLVKWFEKSLLKQSCTIGAEDLKLFMVVDNAKEALTAIEQFIKVQGMIE